MKNTKWIVILAMVATTGWIYAQSFYFGADLSYVNEMEDCGATYTDNDQQQDPYSIFKNHGCNLVRLRLWHTPSWHDQLNDGNRYSDLDDVEISIARAKAEGMKVLLDFHLSDTWADPGHQVVPAAWAGVVNNQEVLADSLGNYIRATLIRLGDQNLLPDIIQIGNETNRGILLSQAVNDQGWTLDWNRNVYLFQAALSAIEETALLYGADIQTAIHIADPEDVPWFVEQFVMHGFTGFDIIGISYYWQWHQPITIPQLGQMITNLRNDYPGKKVMIFETGYGWTTQNSDGANNILFNTHPSYTPLSPANQKKWMTDLTQTVIDHGGSGVVYWEPAWVSTGCETQWVTGSSWDNATFFDFDNKVISDGGIGWMQHPYEFTSATEHLDEPTDALDIFYADGEVIIRLKEHMDFKLPCDFAIYSMDGRRMISKTIASVDDGMIRIPVAGLVAGCYLVILHDNASVIFCP